MNAIRNLFGAPIKGLDFLAPAFDLVVRLWVAQVFFKSGLVKYQSWSSTLELFAYEYAVPVLPPEIAAYLATGAELAMPVLLVLGLGARWGAIVLFILNAVAVISYPEISVAGIKDHYLWGFMLALVVFHGPGKWSIDHFIRKRFMS